jgi:type IV pilus assembly protein PilC
MPLFFYKAIDQQGKTISGQMDAANASDLEQRLTRIGLDLINSRAGDGRTPVFKGRVRRRDLIAFCFHMEQLTKAGVPLLEGLTDLRDSLDHPRFREVIANVIESIEGGQHLSQAMAEHPGVFSPVFVSLIKAGEETGQLPDVLRNLTETLKWQDELASQTKKVLMYPAFVGTVVFVVTILLMIFLVPQLVGFIKGMGQELPLHTRALMFVSDLFVHYWYLIASAPVLAFAVLRLLMHYSPAFRFRVDGWKLRLWLVGPIQRKIILARFANMFALMYGAGITILDAVKISESIAGNLVIEDGLRRVGAQIGEGQSFTASFQNVGLFPSLVLRMLKVGETTGALDDALRNVSYFYDRDVKEAVGRLQALIEPIMTVILGLILGWVMISVLGPIYDTISKLKT